MLYTPYPGDYSRYGLGPQFRFFSGSPAAAPAGGLQQAKDAQAAGSTTAAADVGMVSPSEYLGEPGGEVDGSDPGKGLSDPAPVDGSGFPSVSGLLGDDMTGSGRLPTLGETLGPVAGALAVAIPGLGWANMAATTANTAMNMSALEQMGYSMTPGQMIGGALGMNGFSGAQHEAMNAALSSEVGNGVANLSGRGPTASDIAAYAEQVARDNDDAVADADAPSNLSGAPSMGTSPNAPNPGSYETAALDGLEGGAAAASGDAGFGGGSAASGGEPGGEGNRYARGGLARMADQVAGAGRHGDTELVHLGPAEVAMLEQIMGPATTNPETGYPEHFNFGKFLKSIVPVVAGIVARAVTGGNDLAGAAAQGVTTKVLGGSTRDALTGAALQYGAGKLYQGLSGPDSFTSNITGPMSDFENLGKGPIQDYFSGEVTKDVPVPGMKPLDIYAPSPEGPSKGFTGGAAEPVGDYTPSNQMATPESGLPALGRIARESLMSPAALLAVGTGAVNEYSRPEDPKGAGTGAGASTTSTVSYSSDPLVRNRRDPSADYYTYGLRPEWKFFDTVNAPPVKKARGGLALTGDGGGQDDDIDAKLSAGEFVIPADIVADLGDGNNAAGAQKLDAFMASVRGHKAVKGHPPKAKGISAYLREGRA